MNLIEKCQADATRGCWLLLAVTRTEFCHWRHIICERLANVYKFRLHVY